MGILIQGEYRSSSPTEVTDYKYVKLRSASDHSLVVSRGQEVKTLAASASRTVTSGTNLTAVTIPPAASRAIVALSITSSATDADDTLDVYIDVSYDGGSTYVNAVHFPQQAGNGSAAKYFAVLDPSNPGTSTIAVTSDASAGAVRPALWGTHMRLRYVIADVSTQNAAHTFSSTVLFC